MAVEHLESIVIQSQLGNSKTQIHIADQMMHPDEILDRWFESEAWEQIQSDGRSGCKDSLELMEQVNDQLGSLIFHLSNESNAEKILYELNYFHNLCEDFGVADNTNLF